MAGRGKIVVRPEEIDIFPGTRIERLFLLPHRDVERAHYQWVLDHSASKADAARRLGIHRPTLDYNIKIWGLTPPSKRT